MYNVLRGAYGWTVLAPKRCQAAISLSLFVFSFYFLINLLLCMLQAGYIHVCTCTHVGSLSVGVHPHPVEIYVSSYHLNMHTDCVVFATALNVLLQLKMNFDVVR